MRRQVWVNAGFICHTAVFFFKGDVLACLCHVIRSFSIWKAKHRLVWISVGPICQMSTV